jgi:acyl dehydratase
MRRVAFEELPELAGQEVGVSDWIEIDQDRVNKFAEATGDFQWIHVDVERAQRELGGTIAHGYLTLSLIPMLSDAVFLVEGVSRALNYGSDKVRFLNPVKTGSRVRLRAKILGVEPKSGGLQVKMECSVELDGAAKPACLAETMILYFAE